MQTNKATTFLTNENYFSPEAEQIYMGSTQFKRFLSCEAHALAVLRGEWREEVSTALLVGSYVDAHFSGTLDIFKAQHSEIFKRDGSLKSEYEHANYIIQRIERDELFMRYISGASQKILTGEIEGVPIKVKIDSLLPGECIVDLKIMRDMADVWVDDEGKKSFVEAWGYDIQGAIYQEIERQNRGEWADPLPVVLAVATKEKPEPDIELLSIPQEVLDSAMQVVRAYIGRFHELKQGTGKPSRCGKCDYCRHTKKLTRVIDYRELSV